MNLSVTCKEKTWDSGQKGHEIFLFLGENCYSAFVEQAPEEETVMLELACELSRLSRTITDHVKHRLLETKKKGQY